MTIEFTITDNTVELLANTDTGDNTLYINDTLVPESDWVGSGTYTVDGISIQQISANTGNVYCQKIDDTHYKLVSKLPTSISASQVSYDNAVSGATALQVQAALDELFADKVDKVTGKQLTTEDFTTALLNKLNGIEANANKTIVDSALSTTSTNPVQNKVVKGAIDTINTDLSDTNNYVRQHTITSTGTHDITGTSGYTTANDGYITWSNDNSTSGATYIRVAGIIVIHKNYAQMTNNEVGTLFVRKGMIIKDESTLNSYLLRFREFT